jgi:hypothetical protein
MITDLKTASTHRPVSMKGPCMSALSNLLPKKFGSAIYAGSYFSVMWLALLTSPVIDHHCGVQAAIDETMPGSIPPEVVADWKDQDFGGTSSGDTDCADTAAAIAGKLPTEFAEKYNAQKAGLSGAKLYLLACHFRRVSRMFLLWKPEFFYKDFGFIRIFIEQIVLAVFFLYAFGYFQFRYIRFNQFIDFYL